MLSTFESNILQINIASKRNISLEYFIEKYASKVRDMISKGIEKEEDIDSQLDINN